MALPGRYSVSEREELVEGVQHMLVQVLCEQQRLQRLAVLVHLLVVLPEKQHGYRVCFHNR